MNKAKGIEYSRYIYSEVLWTLCGVSSVKMIGLLKVTTPSRNLHN